MNTRSVLLSFALIAFVPVRASVSAEEVLAGPISIGSFLAQGGTDSSGSDDWSEGRGSGGNTGATSGPPGVRTILFPRGTFQIGLMTGALGFTANVAEEIDPGYIFNLSPALGYFVIRNLELVASFDIVAYFGRYTGNDLVGFSVGIRYLLEIGQPVIPYFGASFGFDFHVASSASSAWEAFVLDIPVGILYKVMKGVFADVGMQVSVTAPLETGWNTSAGITLLRVGFRIYF